MLSAVGGRKAIATMQQVEKCFEKPEAPAQNFLVLVTTHKPYQWF
ncbi:MAG TPA: hypothetical protein VE944_31400 [Nostoc sp.]|nr:hypothetical protein [Nostoc sp.]HYX18798.1 hypothetical protein [Nostoc sp.]